MILHLVPDEKVINRSIEIFEEALPGQNTFICLLNKPKANIVKNYKNVVFFYKDEDVLPNLILYKRVIIHLMTYKSIEFCEKFISKDVPISWIVWGGDIHNQLLVFMGDEYFYTKKHLALKYRFQILISKLGIRWPKINKRLKFLRERVDEYVIEDENTFDILKKRLKNNIRKDAVRKDFFYYPIDKVLGPNLIGKFAKGKVILVNHSASITGNHSYVFDLLKKIDLHDNIIVTPLSYNGTAKYIEYVKRLGTKCFGTKYKPLTYFLPLDKYNELMLSSEICIYGHWRQEAWGNIQIALYLGAKVYLSNKSYIIHLLNELHIKYFILEDLNEKELFIPLSESDKISNRNIILNRYNDKRLNQIIIKNWGYELH